MKKTMLVILIMSIVGISHAAEVSEVMRIGAIEVRESGSHAIFFNGIVPSQSCTNEDRAVIVANGSEGSKALFSAAMAALMNSKEVRVKVDGCTFLNPPEGTLTSPKVTKLLVRGF